MRRFSSLASRRNLPAAMLGATILSSGLRHTSAHAHEAGTASPSASCSRERCRDGAFFRLTAGPLAQYWREKSKYDSWDTPEEDSSKTEHHYESGGQADVSVGGTPWRHAAIAGFMQLAIGSQSEHTSARLMLGPELSYFPDARGGLFTTGRVGLVVSQLDHSDGIGGGVAGVVGYEAWLGSEWSAGVGLQLTAAWTRATEDGDHGAYAYTNIVVAPALLLVLSNH